MQDNKLLINYDELPISVNQYLKPTSRISGGRPLAYMYESTEAKDFKKRFQAFLKRAVRDQEWDINQTAEGHWILECIFIQSRTNQDNNNYYKILCDAMSGIAFIDDKNILVQTKMVMYDAKNPRFSAVLKKAPYIGIFKDEAQFEEFKTSNCTSCKKNTDKCAIIKKSIEGRIQPDIQFEPTGYICSKKKL